MIGITPSIFQPGVIQLDLSIKMRAIAQELLADLC